MAQQFPDVKIVAMDRDIAMLEHARERCADIDRIAFVNDSYANFAQHISGVDFILLDIGVNREHFEDRSR
jgi:16S rRNA C1402 N4-methylase RsmH